MNQVAIIKHNAGNLCSVAFALDRLGVSYDVTDDPETIRSSDYVIFPGVGEAQSAMEYLRAKHLDTLIQELTQPVLGICLGMQLLCQYSEERNTQCLQILDETVVRFESSMVKVPHVGWNRLRNVNGWLPTSLESEFTYFVHSYYVPIGSYTTAVADYGIPFSAALQKDNFYGVQFHPEKSSGPGLQVIESFLKQSCIRPAIHKNS